jgi:hypothetical protein
LDRQLDINDVILIGRIFDEYYAMLGLEDLAGDERILDVASGVSSFCAEANARGWHVTASDRIYGLAPEAIEKKCAADLELMLEKLTPVMDLYRWDYYRDKDALKDYREKAYRRFLKDYSDKGSERYVYANFPESPFGDKQFTISLVSHFLFLYDRQLDYAFHRKTLLELVRVTQKEIRIFPIVNMAGKRSVLVDRLLSDAAFDGYEIAIEKVDFEFLRNANQVMVIRIRNG